MQTIPSRDPSTTNLASSSPRQERMASQPPETPRSNFEPRHRADYTNGDAIEPAPLRFPGSGIPNGVTPQPEVAQLEGTQPSSLEPKPIEKPAEVRLPLSSGIITIADEGRSNAMLKGLVYLLHPTMTFSGLSKKPWQGKEQNLSS